MCTAFCTARGKNSWSVGIASPLIVLSSSQIGLISEVSVLCKVRLEQVTYFGTTLTCPVLGKVQTLTWMPGDSNPRVMGSLYGVEFSGPNLPFRTVTTWSRLLGTSPVGFWAFPRWHNLSVQAVLGFDFPQGEKNCSSTWLHCQNLCLLLFVPPLSTARKLSAPSSL